MQVRQRVRNAAANAPPARDDDVVGQPRTTEVDRLRMPLEARRGQSRSYTTEVRPDTAGVSTIVTIAALRVSAYTSLPMAPLASADARQNERKLADLEERQADGQRHHVPVAERPDDPRQNRRLADDDRQRRRRPAPRAAATRAPGRAACPTDTKNSIPNRSRSGTMSLSAWCAYSDSLITRPATNAPSAIDRPNDHVTYPTPSASVVVESRNSSREFQRATNAISRGTTRVATRTMTPSSRTARNAAAPTG